MNKYLENLNRIEFVVTMACTGRCIHCSEGEHKSSGKHIDGDIAVQAVIDICNNYDIKSLMIFGGEPLIYPEVVCNIHKTAKEMNIKDRAIITNGFFSKDKERVREVAQMLSYSGVQKVLLSVDSFHQETIPLDIVKYFAMCIKESGVEIKLNPAWLVSKEDDNEYNKKTKKIISEFEDLNIPQAKGNVIFPKGNAVKYLSDYFDKNKEYINPYEENPIDVRTISFSENGDVLNGNIYEKSIMEIIEEYKV